MNPNDSPPAGPVKVPSSSQPELIRHDESGRLVVPRLEERLEVSVREVERGGWRIDKRVEMREELVDLPLERDDVTVERRPVYRLLAPDEAPPITRREGDVTIIPVLEEVLVVEKRVRLKEEVILTRTRQAFEAPRRVALRRELVSVVRIDEDAPLSGALPEGPREAPAGLGHPTIKESIQMSQTLIGVFDSHSHALQARDDLVAAGIPESMVQIQSGDSTSMSSTSTTMSSTSTTMDTDGSHQGGFMGWLKTLFGSDDHEDAGLYSEAVRRGSCVVSVQVMDDTEADRARDILQRHDPIDIDEHAARWRSEGWTGGTYATGAAAGGMVAASTLDNDLDGMRGSTTGSSMAGTDLSMTGSSMTGSSLTGTTHLADNQHAMIPVVQEDLLVGKREVQRGGVRVYRRVIETPVEETVNLREERAVVERHAVDRPATEADLAAFTEGSIEVREMGEEAVVSKRAHVVEEVEVGKEVTQRQDTIRDTVRRTDVEVEHLEDEHAMARGTRRDGGLLDSDKPR